MKNKLILASSSPRRIEIMEKHGYHPEILPADIDETLPAGISMTDAVLFLALKKAQAAEARTEGGSIIIAADTVVYKEEILGKPKDRSDAFRMLSLLRNTFHYVTTGVALLRAGETQKKAFYAVTKVFCTDFSDEELNAYLDTDEPYDKAGAYAIQGLFGKYIDHYEGSYENVVGLPFEKIEEELKAFI